MVIEEDSDDDDSEEEEVEEEDATTAPEPPKPNPVVNSAVPPGRGLRSSTSQHNLSRVGHQRIPCTP